jgi:hypothetical protein
MTRNTGIFRFAPKSNTDGSFAAAWFDDEPRLWKDARLHKADSLMGKWSAPELLLHDPAKGATEVLFNPEAYAVSERIRESLSTLPEIEFLPIHLAGAGVYYLLHVTTSFAAPPGSSLRRAPAPSGNIFEILEFPHDWKPSARVFRVQQPPDSVAGRIGSCALGIFANPQGAQTIEFACGDYLEMRQMGHA